MHQVVAGVVEMTGDGWRTERRRIGQQLLDAVGLRRVRARRVAEMEAA